MEEIINLLKEIKDYSTLLVPSFFFLLLIWFMLSVRFASWCIDMHDKNEEDKFKRLQKKYESRKNDESGTY